MDGQCNLQELPKVIKVEFSLNLNKVDKFPHTHLHFNCQGLRLDQIMKVVECSIEQALAMLRLHQREKKTLIEQGNEQCPSFRLLFTASWLSRSQAHASEIDHYLQGAEQEGVEAVYLVESQGNDDAEDFVLDNVEEPAFPVMLDLDLEDGGDGGVELSDADVLRDMFTDADADADTGTGGFGVLFVSGDRSSVGKSTTCMSLLATLVDTYNIPPEDVGYIKPVTQCEAEQPVVRYCESRGIECIGVGPVVFYKGFTRAFLQGQTESSAALIAEAVAAVEVLKTRRKFVLVDGVGYPSVGSICGISNAHVAKALNAPVVLVGKSGVGDAVDSHNLNSAFFQHHGVHVLGSIFNKLATEGFYNREACKEAIDMYFEKYGEGQKAYGYVPLVHTSDNNSAADGISQEIADNFTKHVNVFQLLVDTYRHAVYGGDPHIQENSTIQPASYSHTESNGDMPASTAEEVQPAHSKKRSREDIELLARKQGARGG